MVRLVRLGNIATVSQGMGMSGRAAGALAGDWHVNLVSVGDIRDDRFLLETVRPTTIQQNANTEKYLVMPDDHALYRIADLVDASERAHAAALRAAERRRSIFRDALIERLLHETKQAGETACR